MTGKTGGTADPQLGLSDDATPALEQLPAKISPETALHNCNKCHHHGESSILGTS